MSIVYLIKNRERPPILSKRWLIVWAKRGLTFPELLKNLFSVWYCRVRGGEVGALSIIEGTLIVGNISNLKIGNESFIAKTVNFALHEKIDIGSRVVINNGVQLLTASHDLNDSSWQMYSKPIVIEDYAWVATNAIILPGVRVGTGAVIGAGAIVRKNVEPFHIFSGDSNSHVIKKRVEFLNYSPVSFCSSYEAWLGKNR